MQSCNLETALAKKLGHVVTRGELSKAKHLYDIHAITKAKDVLDSVESLMRATMLG